MCLHGELSAIAKYTAVRWGGEGDGCVVFDKP